jgi:hypothetical protein
MLQGRKFGLTVALPENSQDTARVASLHRGASGRMLRRILARTKRRAFESVSFDGTHIFKVPLLPAPGGSNATASRLYLRVAALISRNARCRIVS